ncbi:MAG TPA: DUF72 domain-containing protein, partial [Candidatus Limnocylindria bacterium]|nr:DUF72 domain-containing protein [Candidatus Limnocylindria bacterium]
GYYAERFPTVEINYSFYRMPTPAMARAWALATPASFVFALKAPKRITHDRRLVDVADALALYLEAAAALGARRGPLFFQLPPTFKKQTERLRDLLALVPAGMRCAFEFRHLSWFADDVYDSLRAHDAALCLADTEAGATPDVATASWGYLRLRDVDYDDTQLHAWARAAQRSEWKDTFVYFKHEETASGPRLASRLRELTGA